MIFLEKECNIQYYIRSIKPKFKLIYGREFMKTEQIFQEFEQRFEKEYYAQLASKEILTVPLLIEIFLDDDYANAHWAEQVLEYICEVNPKLVYPFFEFVAKGRIRRCAC